MENEKVWLFWLIISLIAFFAAIITVLMIRHFWVKCKKAANKSVNLNPMDDEYFNEPITYIFKTDKGIIVKNNEKVPHQFTIDKAKHYAKCFSDYEIQMYGETQWHSCSTYFI